MKNLLTALFFVITFSTYSQTPITDYNFSEAIKTCLTMSPGDGMCSSSEYGAMPDWDVSNVTNMKDAFNIFDMKKPKKIQVENNVVKILTAIRDNKNINAFELLDNMVNESDIKIRGFWMQLLLDLTNRSASSSNFYIKVSGRTRINTKDSVKILPAGIDYLLDPCSFYVKNDYMFKRHSNVGKLIKYKNNFNADISKWDVSNVTDMSYMFFGADSFKQDISSWNVSKVIDMSYMFKGFGVPHPFSSVSVKQKDYIKDLTKDRGEIGRWDVSNVTNMRSMFSGAPYNPDISNWDVSNVIDMSYMFSRSIFNQNISNWDVSNVESMLGMFGHNRYFNQNIGNWDVSKVTDMSLMFFNTPIFNQNISSWDVASVKDMHYMFSGTGESQEGNLIGFNQDIGNWNVSNVTNMKGMFYNSIFNQDISNWDVGNVINMSSMFGETFYFNQDISNWDVSNVIDMNNMFSYAAAFNQNIGSWDVSNVVNMRRLFYFEKKKDMIIFFNDFNGSVFNQDISNWNVSNVINMTNMFYGASSFNQDLGRWNVNNVKTAYNFVNDKNTQWKHNKPKFNNLIKFYKVGLKNSNYNIYLPQSMSCSNKDYEDSVIKSSDNYSGIEEYSIGDSVNYKNMYSQLIYSDGGNHFSNICVGNVHSGIIKDIDYTNVDVDFQTLNQLNDDSLISKYVLTNDVASNNSDDSQKCYSSNKIKDFK
jgi:surface protein